jgi:beta-lactamase superfamily II metal-dependent hydrolase
MKINRNEKKKLDTKEIEAELEAAIKVDVLPAGYGDCLLVSCPKPGGTWRLLVDTGPDETWPVLRTRLSQIPTDEDGRRHIDLVIVSHIDHDHIGATRFLFADQSLGLSFGDVWFNGRNHLIERGIAEGEALSELLSASKQCLPWNTAFQGGAVVVPGDDEFVEVTALSGHPLITLLSPTQRRLDRLAQVWDTELEKLRDHKSNTKEEYERGSLFPDLEALTECQSFKDTSPSNGSSIAILLEHRGTSVLLAADAFATVLGKAMLGLATHRGLSHPLLVDILKLSHHGSRANLLSELLGAVQARHYVVSTNNDRFHHPNDEALARVVRFGGDTPMLWFNYVTEQNLRWADKALQQKYRFGTRFPENEARGITLICYPTFGTEAIRTSQRTL